MRVRLDLGLGRTLDSAGSTGTGSRICDMIGRQRLRDRLQRGSHRGRHGGCGAAGAAATGRRTNCCYYCCRCCYCCQLDVRQFDPSLRHTQTHTHSFTVAISVSEVASVDILPAKLLHSLSLSIQCSYSPTLPSRNRNTHPLLKLIFKSAHLGKFSG